MASKNPPLAGRPPFATDEPDSVYESSPGPQRRVRMQAPPDPNGRTSAYDVYVILLPKGVYQRLRDDLSQLGGLSHLLPSAESWFLTDITITLTVQIASQV